MGSIVNRLRLYITVGDVDNGGYLAIDESMKLVPSTGEYRVKILCEEQEVESTLFIDDNKRININNENCLGKSGVVAKIIG